jgi:hypothetical protein
MRGSPGIEREPLEVVPIGAIDLEDSTQWLIEGLWTEEAVGIVSGQPKLGKTWLALDLALSVATGTPALEKYPVPRPGPVLIFAAEDPPKALRSRLEGLCARRNLQIGSVPVNLILASSLRLDTFEDQARLAETVARHRPRLLVLDPFVRLHRIDENSALEVSGVLAYLRQLQREEHVAILVVHHSRKAGAESSQAGLSLRGSSDFYAWGDAYLYLRRRKSNLEMVVEHRNAPRPDPVELVLRVDGSPHLEVLPFVQREPSLDSMKDRIVEILSRTSGPVTQESLRAELRVRLQKVVSALRELERDDRIKRLAAGWSLPSNRNGSYPDRESLGIEP